MPYDEFRIQNPNRKWTNSRSSVAVLGVDWQIVSSWVPGTFSNKGDDGSHAKVIDKSGSSVTPPSCGIHLKCDLGAREPSDVIDSDAHACHLCEQGNLVIDHVYKCANDDILCS